MFSISDHHPLSFRPSLERVNVYWPYSFPASGSSQPFISTGIQLAHTTYLSCFPTIHHQPALQQSLQQCLLHLLPMRTAKRESVAGLPYLAVVPSVEGDSSRTMHILLRTASDDNTHRLKLRCDRQAPCQSCVKRGCGAICPDGVSFFDDLVIPDTHIIHRVSHYRPGQSICPCFH
jgi:hypothetical protein